MFTSPDTLIPDLYNPLDWNRYLYARANPTKYIDPTGHMQVCAQGDLGGGCGSDGTSLYIYDKYQERKKSGTITYWAGLTKAEQKALARNDWNPDIWEDAIGGPGVTKADPLHDPVTYITSVGPIFSSIARGISIGLAGSAIRAETAAARNAIGATGNIGEMFLKQAGGESQRYFRTSVGGRYIDQVINGMAYESKVGSVKLTDFVSRQVAKDVELMVTGQVDSVSWVFFKSPVTGKIGPSEGLYQLLIQNGISVFFVP